MFRLGLQLALNSGREALVRLLLTTIAVAIGVTVLLGILAEFHAFQSQSNRPSWETTAGVSIGQSPGSTSNAELWNYSEDTFKGQTIERLDVAALGPKAPIIPGLSKLPATGQYYASPALTSLLRSVPADELGNRFPGKQVGTIGNQGLSGPDELAIAVGYTRAQLTSAPNTIEATNIATTPNTQGTTSFLRFAFGVGAVGVLFPMLILISTATKLSATRREERYASMRLVGFTPHQINVLASVDALVGASLGTLVGIGVFVAALQPIIADKAILGARFFSYSITPTVWGYVAVLLGVPLASILGARLSLLRVQISPLGVSRKATPPAPKVWRILPLLLGIPIFIVPVLLTSSKNPTAATAYPGLILIMIGLLMGGPWLTMQASRAFGKLTTGLPSLIAVRHLADNPKAAFRSVSGLVLAVFVGTIIAGIAPVALATQKTVKTDALSNVLAEGFAYAGNPSCNGSCDSNPVGNLQNYGLPPQDGAKLISQLRSYAGVSVFPIYSIPAANIGRGDNPADSIMSCQDLVQLSALGQCAPGLTAVKVFTDQLVNDYSTTPIVTQSSPAASDNFDDLYLRAMLVKTNNPTTLEEVRTLLTHVTLSASSIAPKTFGEVREQAAHTSVNVERIIYVAIGLTMLIAGCSLAVSVSGSLVERKRPFMLLRLSGISVSTLYKAVLLESVLPLGAAILVTVGTGFGLSVLIVRTLAPAGTSVPVLSMTYYLSIGVGLFVSLAIVMATLPLLGSITRPDSVRFE